MTAVPCPRCGADTGHATLPLGAIFPYVAQDGSRHALVGGGPVSRCGRCGLLGFHTRDPGTTRGTHRVVWISPAGYSLSGVVS